MSKKPATTPPEPAADRLAEALARSQDYIALARSREPSSKVLAVRVPVSLRDRLMAEAEARGLPLAEFVRVLLAAGVDALPEQS